jgi:hypothetical protein
MTVGGARPPRQPPLSVALCTFEGERYLPELLESIEDQRRQPNEVVVCDDGSRDRTMDILERFRERVRFPVEIRVNEERLGSTKNFEKAIDLCSGGTIFLCDQDDVWHEDKLHRVSEALDRAPRAGVVFTNAELIDDRSRSLGRLLWPAMGLDADLLRRVEGGRTLDVLLERNVVTGATMAFRSSLKDLVLPVPDGWVQDYWIALLSAAVSEVRPIPTPLVRYRVHPAQQIGLGKGSLGARDPESERAWSALARRARVDERAALLEQAQLFGGASERLRARSSDHPTRSGVLETLDAKVKHLGRRGRMHEIPARWRVVFDELRSGRYHRYSAGFAAAAKDLLLLDRRASRGADREGAL